MGSSGCCIVGVHKGKCKGIVMHSVGDWGGGATDFFECLKCKFDDGKWVSETKPKWIKFTNATPESPPSLMVG